MKSIIATLNNNIIAFKDEKSFFIPHGKKSIELAEKNNIHIYQSLLDFKKIDSTYFKEYIKKIEDDSIIVIGENTFKDSFLLFKNLLFKKNISFIISNQYSFYEARFNKNEWILSHDLKYFNASELKEYVLNKNNYVYIMGGVSIYSIFSDKIKELTYINYNIDNNLLESYLKKNNIDCKIVINPENMTFKVKDKEQKVVNSLIYEKNNVIIQNITRQF